MTDLLVDRMSVRATARGPQDETRLRALLTDLTGRRLDEALAAVTLPEGHWCLRRMQVTLPYDAAAADTAIARRWARTVAEALAGTIATTADPDVVHYARPLEARTEVVAELALGRAERAWAWRAVGVLAGGDADPATAPREVAVSVLVADRGATVPVLVGAVRRAGLPAVHRLLGGHGWAQLAAVVLESHGLARGDQQRGAGGRPRLGAPGVAGPVAAPSVGTDLRPTSGAGRSGAGSVARDARPTSAAVLTRSTFVAACRGGRVRPTGDVARAWAVLAVAEAEPAALRRPDLDAVLDLVTAALDPRAGTLPRVAEAGAERQAGGSEPAPASGAGAARPDPARAPVDERDAAPPPPLPAADPQEAPLVTGGSPGRHGDADRAPAGGAADAVPPPRPAPPPEPRPPDADLPGAVADLPAPVPASSLHPTSWGGLVYLLATAADAGIPAALLGDDRLGGRPATWLLFHLLRLLTGPAPDAATDPAVRVLAGLAPDETAPQPEPAAGELAALLGHGAVWARVTAERLGDEDPPPEVVRRITARTGTVESVPGWTELRLRLDDVDIAVRRAGLDVDPGFVPWLGAVVVIRYV